MNAQASSGRIEYVDRLRGLAVVGMFFVHSGVAWLDSSVKGTPYWKAVSTISGMVAPVFMFLAGLSVALLAHKARGSNGDIGALRRRISVRGLKIIALGYAMHLCFFFFGGMHGPWVRVLKVDILHCIGVGLAVFPWIAWPARRFNLRALALFIALVLGSLITFRLPLQQWLHEGLAAYFSVRPKIALFPVIPYAAWIALGLFIGAVWAPVARDQRAERRFWVGLLIAAVLVNFAAMGVKSAYYHLHIFELGGDDRPQKGLAHWFLFKTAWLFVLFGLARATAPLLDRVRPRFFVLFGQRSLFAYVAHLCIIYHLGGAYLSRSLAPTEQLLGAAGLTLVMYGLVQGWARRMAIGGMIRKNRS